LSFFSKKLREIDYFSSSIVTLAQAIRASIASGDFDEEDIEIHIQILYQMLDDLLTQKILLGESKEFNYQSIQSLIEFGSGLKKPDSKMKINHKLSEANIDSLATSIELLLGRKFERNDIFAHLHHLLKDYLNIENLENEFLTKEVHTLLILGFMLGTTKQDTDNTSMHEKKIRRRMSAHHSAIFLSLWLGGSR